MSGGTFDYIQYRLGDVVDSIEDIITNNKVEISREELSPYCFDDDGNVYEEYKYKYYFNDITIEKFKEAVNIIKMASIYIQRVDWLLAGDDGENSFIERLEKELKELKKENK